MKENDSYIWDTIAVALERGDREAARKLEAQLFAEPKYTNRGSRGSLRSRSYFSGYLALYDGDTGKAIENYKEALLHSPPTWDIDAFEDCLADAYLETGKFDLAIAEYQRILRLNPNYPLAHFYIAQAYRAKGLNEEARASYITFLDVWKNADQDIPEIKEAQRFTAS